MEGCACAGCTGDENWQDSLLDKVKANNANYGWAVQGVAPGEEDDGPQFQYTVGLAAHDRPELIVFGLRHDIGQTILNDLAQRVRDGEQFTAGQTLPDVFAHDYPCLLIEVIDTSEHLTVANRLYRRTDPFGARIPVGALQLVFQDSAHRWPWEPDSAVADMPLLGPAPGNTNPV